MRGRGEGFSTGCSLTLLCDPTHPQTHHQMANRQGQVEAYRVEIDPIERDADKRGLAVRFHTAQAAM